MPIGKVGVLSLTGRSIGQIMIGEKLGKYTILAHIGSGSMGTVYKAEDSATGHLVAIKLIRSFILYNRDRRERFLQQLLTALEIRHPKLCPILEIGDDDNDFFVVTPYVEGISVENLGYRKNLTWERALDVGLEVCEALTAIHAGGVVHRGIKPSNIWIKNDGNVLIGDCGLSRFTELEREESFCRELSRGEPADTLIPLTAIAYMSPEQVRGGIIDRRSDIFSLGAVLYELLAGRHPFEARNSLARISAILEADPAPLTSRSRQLPSALDGVIRKALEKLPDFRYASAADFAVQLKYIRQSGPFPLPAAKTAVSRLGSGFCRVVLNISLLALALLSGWFLYFLWKR